MMHRLILVVAVVATALVPGVAGAFDGEKELYDAARKEKELTWYTAHYNTETAAAICGGFEKQYPGVACKYVRTTAQVAYQRLAQDQKAGIAQASVISSTDASHYGKMKLDGWLQKYRPKNLAELADAFKPYNDPDDLFVATAAGLVLLTYNTAAVPAGEAPKKWTDLLDPKWKNKVSIGHPGFSGYVGTWVVQMKKLYGWDYFKKLELNKPRIGRSINDTVTMLNARESLVAAGPSATTLESRAKGNPLGVVYPEDGAVLMVSPTGILKNAPAPNAAKLFEEYLLSRACNELIVQHAQDPVNKFVKPMAGGKSIAEVKTIRPTYEEIDKGIPEVKELFRETFGI
ncbi:MAG TPA: extracellular solute-binding protein [Methylomirabilota bacterium]|nr:extracellular solute-binding protein [Methylomirabilota bacterium]